MCGMIQADRISDATLTQFETCPRLVTTDRYEPNTIRERAYNMIRDFELLLHLYCQCHIAASGLALCSKLLNLDFAGCRGYIGAYRTPGQMPKVQAANRSTLWRKLVPRRHCRVIDDARGRPRAALDKHLRHQIFCAPGDWRDHTDSHLSWIRSVPTRNLKRSRSLAQSFFLLCAAKLPQSSDCRSGHRQIQLCGMCWRQT